MNDEQESNLEWLLDKLSAKGAGKSTPAQNLPDSVKKQQDLTDRKAADFDLWKKWKDNGEKPEHLEPILKNMAGLIQQRVNYYKNRVEIPTAAIEHEHKKWVVDALKTYDPTKGTALATHVRNRLVKVNRFVDTNKNFARISENVSKYIGSFNAIKSDLRERLGHEPDDHMLHDHILKNPMIDTKGREIVLSLKDIRRLGKEQRKGLIQTGHDPDEISGQPNMSSREKEVVELIYFQLSPEEKKVYEYTFGSHGKPKLKPGEIAKTLGMDNSKVSKLRTSIRKKVLGYLGE